MKRHRPIAFRNRSRHRPPMKGIIKDVKFQLATILRKKTVSKPWVPTPWNGLQHKVNVFVDLEQYLPCCFC